MMSCSLWKWPWDNNDELRNWWVAIITLGLLVNLLRLQNSAHHGHFQSLQLIIIILWPLIKTAAHHYCTMATHKVCRLLLLSHGHSHRLQLIIIILRPVINSAAHHYYLMAIPKVCSSSLLFYGHSSILQLIITIL